MTARSNLHQELGRKLEKVADRICELQDQLLEGHKTLKPSEYDRLLDTYRAELVRYDRIDKKLQDLEEPRKTQKNKEKQSRQTRQQRDKINY